MPLLKEKFLDAFDNDHNKDHEITLIYDGDVVVVIVAICDDDDDGDDGDNDDDEEDDDVDSCDLNGGVRCGFDLRENTVGAKSRDESGRAMLEILFSKSEKSFF